MVKNKALLKKGLMGVALAGVMLASSFMIAGCSGDQQQKENKGSIWYSGTQYSAIQGVVGDFFFDTNDYDIYKKTADGWVWLSNIKEDSKIPTITFDSEGFIFIDGVKTDICIYDSLKAVPFSNLYSINSVAHRGYSTDAPENTLSAYKLARKNGFSKVECDVSFTKDGKGVLLHDESINRTSNGTGNISQMTLEEVRQYDFGSWFSSEYVGEQIPTFEEFIKLCKSLSLHPYIEIKRGATQANVESLVTTVTRYGMIDNVTWISFESSALAYVKNRDATARLGYIVYAITENTIETAKSLRTDENNEVFIDAEYSSINSTAINLCIAELVPLEVWTVNDINAILNLDPYISGVTSDNKLAGQILYEHNKN